MIYSTPEFVLLFLLTFLAYVCAPGRRTRFAVLLAASLAFYAWTGPTDTAVFLCVVAGSWLSAALARRDPARKRIFLSGGIVLMALHLFFWKYAPWAVSQAQAVWPGFLRGRGLDLPLPIGLSFFTLQGIAYLADYAADEAKYMSFPTYLLFKSFFAQLVAGPIVRAKQLLPQLERLERPRWEDVSFGLFLFTAGFFKKLAIADRVAPFVDEVFLRPDRFGRAVLIKAVLGYSAQIWADFSGYTDMGRGAARMLGIRLPENFLSPYLARGPAEFWRRWHVTLGEWIRDYLYAPLGGGRGSPIRVFGVVVLVMSLSGLWHGASWTFLIWGLYHGLLLAVDRGLRLGERARRPPERIAAVAVTFSLVAFGWLIFRAGSTAAVYSYVSALARGGGGASPLEGRLLVPLSLAIAIQFAGYYDLETRRWTTLERLKAGRVWAACARKPSLAFGLGALVAATFAAALLLRPDSRVGFIYFQF